MLVYGLIFKRNAGVAVIFWNPFVAPHAPKENNSPERKLSGHSEPNAPEAEFRGHESRKGHTHTPDAAKVHDSGQERVADTHKGPVSNN